MHTTRFDDERDSTACRGCDCDYLEVLSDGRDLCRSCRLVAELQAEIKRLTNRTCEWEENFDSDGLSTCDTSCGNVYEDTDRKNPCPHAWVYCPACSGKIVVKQEPAQPIELIPLMSRIQ